MGPIKIHHHQPNLFFRSVPTTFLWLSPSQFSRMTSSHLPSQNSTYTLTLSSRPRFLLHRDTGAVRRTPSTLASSPEAHLPSPAPPARLSRGGRRCRPCGPAPAPSVPHTLSSGLGTALQPCSCLSHLQPQQKASSSRRRLLRGRVLKGPAARASISALPPLPRPASSVK